MKPLHKKVWRDIKRHPGQFASVSAIIICASALFIGMYSTQLNLEYSKQQFYQKYRFCDVFITLERAPKTALRRLAGISGVDEIRGRIVKDVTLEIEGNPFSVVGRVVSMPTEKKPVLNDIHIVRGSYFTGANSREVIVNQRFSEENDLEVGDTIEATLEGVREKLTIVGTAYSPEYVYPLRTARQFLPDDRNFGILFVQDNFAEHAFDMSGALNDVSAILSPTADPDAVLETMEKHLDAYGVHAAYTRDDHISHYYVMHEIDAIRGWALVLPLVFLLIAALILHIMLARITEQQRAQIGTLIAIGYSRRSVAVHYLSYGAIIAIIATLAGTILGFFLSGGMLVMFLDYFRFHELINRFHPRLSLITIALTTGSCLAGVLYTVVKVVNIQPALAMKPKAPPSAHAIFIERLPRVWNRLGLVSRTTIRTCMRAKTRSLLTLLGVIVSAILLFFGFWSGNLFDYMLIHQFEMVDRSDLLVEFRREKGLNAVGELRDMAGVRGAEGVLNLGAELRKDWKTQNIVITGLPPDSTMYNVYGAEGRPIKVPERGLIMPEYLMGKLGLRTGDSVEIEVFIKDKPVRTVDIAGTTREYIGMTAYADRRYLARLVGEGDMVNGALLSVPHHELTDTIGRLGDRPGILSAVSQSRMIESFNEMVSKVILIMAGIITLIAGLIAFAVIYSTSAINISEREREIASLLAMGWTPQAASEMVTADVLPMGFIGLALGLPVGRILVDLLSFMFDSEMFRIPRLINFEIYVQVSAILMIFILLSRLICMRKASKVDMLKALGTRE